MKYSLNSRGGLTRCMLVSASRRLRRRSCCWGKLLQMLYSIRSERLLMEEMDYNLLFRWFVGLNADDEVWDPTVFSKNRDRLLEAETLLEAWASTKSFQPKDEKPLSPPDDPGNTTVNFRGQRRSNETHASKTDPEALLARRARGRSRN